MNVEFANAAKADLVAIGDYISQDNPDRASTFIDEIVDCCERLAMKPYAHALVPRFADFGIRKRTFGNYLIFYHASEERVEILHVLNAARDYEAILLADND